VQEPGNSVASETQISSVTSASMLGSAGKTERSTYPCELEVDRRIVDGSLLHVRPILPSDAQRLRKFHDSLSSETQYRRFFSAHPHLSWSEALRFTSVDYSDRLALIAEFADRLVGVARYDRLPETASAEVAFVVTDDWQHRGVGTMLLSELAKAAGMRGINRFVAETLVDNALMIAVFSESGFQVHREWRGGVLHVWFDIEPDDE
jgi:RimJ/RimL family protein N-acetyltransferase